MNGILVEWISVDERLPDESEIILAIDVTLPYEDCIAEYCVFSDGQFYDESVEIKMENVTHWMKLPEPPANEVPICT